MAMHGSAAAPSRTGLLLILNSTLAAAADHSLPYDATTDPETLIGSAA